MSHANGLSAVKKILDCSVAAIAKGESQVAAYADAVEQLRREGALSDRQLRQCIAADAIYEEECGKLNRRYIATVNEIFGVQEAIESATETPED